MLMLACAIAIMVLLISLAFWFHSKNRCINPLFPQYPILGMLPHLLFNMKRAHNYTAESLIKCGATGQFIGPLFSKMDCLVTMDPDNVHHVMIKNFNSYVKGRSFREMFQVFGDGIFTADSKSWEYSRMFLHSLFKRRRFEMLVERTVYNKLQNGLLPLFDHVKGTVVDLQDVFARMAFDNISYITLGWDSECLSLDFPRVPIQKAFHEAEEAIFYRHVVPKGVWKFQKWLGIGQEKKLEKARKTLDQFIFTYLAYKREEIRKCNEEMMEAHDTDDLLISLMINEKISHEHPHDDRFLRDAVFNIFVAGTASVTSALTWFFWLVATNPLVEAKILEEIKERFGDANKHHAILSTMDVRKLLYLHGAICEALRLYPSIPFERKQAVEADVLPSGHYVHPKTLIVFSLYAMGRSEEIWGKDCLEFKPERWLTDQGGFIFMPSHKFTAFNAGPRTCLGKDSSFIQLKMIAASILINYRVQVVKGFVAKPNLSVVLGMKDGLKVKISKRKV